MTDKKYIAIIYEGEKTESQLLNNLNKNFFKDISELVPIMFPAGENIYMLWKQLKKDDFETDLGKLYVNYPMVESLRDNKPPLQEYCFRNCAISLDEIGSYKHSVHTLQDYQDFRKLDHKKWGELCVNAVCKASCIINDRYLIPERWEFIENMGQHNLYIRQKEKYITVGKIAVINSFPLFLLEYFKEDFWNEMLISYTDKPIRETIECKEIISTSICQKI